MTARIYRRASYLQTLVFYGEVHLCLLRQGKQLYIATAVPHETHDRFLAVSVKPGDWELYLANRHDLRYLFVYPRMRMFYYFNLSDLKDGTVRMLRYTDPVPGQHIPAPRFFAADHTEKSNLLQFSEGVETLYLDGEWELTELGGFQKRISDVYNFIYSIEDWRSKADEPKTRQSIESAFTSRPFKGGSSYGAYFDDLRDRLQITERVRLKSIVKASPGDMKIYGVQEIFHEVELLVLNYLDKRVSIDRLYRSLYGFLQKNGLLSQSVGRFSQTNQLSSEILHRGEELLGELGIECFDEVRQITGHNALGAAKIILALSRRIESAANFFAQGRASFEKPS